MQPNVHVSPAFEKTRIGMAIIIPLAHAYLEYGRACYAPWFLRRTVDYSAVVWC